MKNRLVRKNFLKNIEARVAPVTVFMLLLLSVFSTVFILAPDSVSAADSTLRQETFEGDTPGSNPSDSWYGFEEDAAYAANVTSWDAYGGSNSLVCNGSTASTNDYAWFNLTEPFNGMNFSCWFKVTSAYHNNSYMGFQNSTSGDYLTVFQCGDAGNGNNKIFLWHASADKNDPGWTFNFYEWYNIQLQFNFTDDTFRGILSNVSFGVISTSIWYPFYSGDLSNVDTLSILNTDDGTYVLYDDIQFGDTPVDDSSSFSLSGGVGTSNNISWSGEAGDIVWSNATAGLGGTLNISYNVNVSDNCTEIRVNLSHLSVAQGILNTNISLIFDDNNVSWTGNVVAYSGTNFSVNESVWAANSWGGSPFPLDGAGWVNGSIYCRMRLAIPSSASASTYSQTDWKVWFKVVS